MTDFEAVDNLLTNWNRRSREAEMQHYNAASFYGGWHVILGMSSVVLTVVATTGLIPDLGKSGNKHDMALGIVAVLAGVQTFFGFAQKGEIHRKYAASYGHLRRFIEEICAFAPYLENDGSSVENVISSLHTLADAAPVVPKIVWCFTWIELKINKASPLIFGNKALPIMANKKHASH